MPYGLMFSAMIPTNSNRGVLLVGGYTPTFNKVVGSMLKLETISSEWRTIDIPMNKLRYGHIAFSASSDQMKVFCGN